MSTYKRLTPHFKKYTKFEGSSNELKWSEKIGDYTGTDFSYGVKYINFEQAVNRLSELEDKIEARVLPENPLYELPEDRWVITVDSIKNPTNYMVEHQNPKAEFWNGAWHISYEEIYCRKIYEIFDTVGKAYARCSDLEKSRGRMNEQ